MKTRNKKATRDADEQALAGVRKNLHAMSVLRRREPEGGGLRLLAAEAPHRHHAKAVDRDAIRHHAGRLRTQHLSNHTGGHMRVRDRSSKQGKDQEVIQGVQKDLQTMSSLPLGGTTYTPGSLVPPTAAALTPEQQTEAIEKRAATRKARRTLGPKAKRKVTAVAPAAATTKS